MRRIRLLPVLVSAALLAVSCGDDDTADTTTAPPAESTTSEPATTESATTEPATTEPATTVAPTTVPAGLEQPAIWPAADVVFATPEEAAADFVAAVLGEGPTLGEFMAGDSRSGEIELLSPGEGDAPVTSPRGVLLMRQLGPDSGWFVLAVANDHAAIQVPESGATVPAGPLTVEGVARGFEANVQAIAFVAGHADDVLDQQFTMAGSLDVAEPFSVTLDLTGATPGDLVVILIRGGAGLETDPGEVGAIPVLIAG